MIQQGSKAPPPTDFNCQGNGLLIRQFSFSNQILPQFFASFFCQHRRGGGWKLDIRQKSMALFAQHFFLQSKSQCHCQRIYILLILYYTGEVKIIRMFFLWIIKQEKNIQTHALWVGSSGSNFWSPLNRTLKFSQKIVWRVTFQSSNNTKLWKFVIRDPYHFLLRTPADSTSKKIPRFLFPISLCLCLGF